MLIGLLGCALLLIAQTAFWSWKTSGVLQSVQDWHRYPWGYAAVTTPPHLGEWPFAKENLIYVQHHQAFLGVTDQYVRPTSGFEHQRTLYAYLTTGLWFLGPLFSGIALNVLLWALAVLASMYIARTLFPGRPWTPWIAALLVLSGQGFLHSVGEVAPHVLGYGTGFFVGAYACAKRLWSDDSRSVDHWLVHGLLGILKLGYEAAWFSYPFLLLVSYRAAASRAGRPLSWSTVGFLVRCSVFSLGPGLLMIALSRPFGATDSVSGAVQLVSQRPLAELLVAYVLTLADSVLSFGPFVLVLAATGTVAAVHARDRVTLLWLGAIVAMLVVTAVVLLPYPARGYSTFGLALPLFIVAIQGYSWIWMRRSVWRYVAPALMACGMLWANAPLVGCRLPLEGFAWGYLSAAARGHWQTFDIIQLR